MGKDCSRTGSIGDRCDNQSQTAEGLRHLLPRDREAL
uniref:DnaJ heat shock protein family (Hsp40) member C1 n=1 Tax=Pipistrellus kuhlii TaxID=59472 RepID=A0A7J8AZZ4_PIPKU|nr:DnaJ heat shock protein family (Hsp40) member C1 [Pipistrellus kuhlii]